MNYSKTQLEGIFDYDCNLIIMQECLDRIMRVNERVGDVRVIQKSLIKRVKFLKRKCDTV